MVRPLEATERSRQPSLRAEHGRRGTRCWQGRGGAAETAETDTFQQSLLSPRNSPEFSYNFHVFLAISRPAYEKPSRYMNLQALHRVRECQADLRVPLWSAGLPCGMDCTRCAASCRASTGRRACLRRASI